MATGAIRDGRFEDEPSLILEGESLRAEIVPGYGGQVIGLRHREFAFELLRRPKTRAELQDRPFLFGVPVLFPPGRLRGGRFTLGGRDYVWPINDRQGPNHLHGFVWGRPWRVVKREDGSEPEAVLAFEAAAGSEAATRFGHPFRLTIAYRLDGESLTIEAEAENLDTVPMPLALGYHTTWNLVGEDGRRLDYVGRLPRGREWRMGDDVMPTGEVLQPRHFLGWQSGQHLWDFVSDHIYLVDRDVANVVELELAEPRLAVRMWAESPFRNWVVYRPDREAGFMSIEPVSWVHNAPNLTADPAESGVALLSPGEKARYVYAIEAKR